MQRPREQKQTGQKQAHTSTSDLAKGIKNYSGDKTDSSAKGAGKLDEFTRWKHDSSFSPYTKIKSRQIP